MKIKIIHKYFLLAFACLVLFLVLGLGIEKVIGRALMNASSPPQMAPTVSLAKIVDHLKAANKIEAVKELNQWHEGLPIPKLVLVDAKGTVLFPESYPLPFDWNKIAKPVKAYEYTLLPSLSNFGHGPAGPPDGPGGPGPMWDHGPPPPPMMEQPMLVRLDDPTTLYLYIPPPFLGPPGQPSDIHREHQGNNFFRFMPWIGFASLLVSLLLGVGTALALINSSVQRQVRLADVVISDLQKGNLKARFPILNKDEFSQAMMRFNVMADEIEKLVVHMHDVEQSRTKLLQELAHDLRTPIASLKNLLETLNIKSDDISPSVKKEFLELSLKEVDYFERLVEDLLFLAQVNEPKYQTQREQLDVVELLNEEAEDCSFRRQQQAEPAKSIQLTKDFKTENILMDADIHLIRRLFRNALENAFSFANSSVKIFAEMDEQKKQIRIRIEDDGPGFSKETLASFTERRLSRKLNQGQGKRLSVGLGSVIMKAICGLHRGELRASNLAGQGAVIEIQLPT